MKTLLLAFAVSMLVFLSSCAGGRAQAQERVLDCDVVFEYHAIPNDSITVLVDKTLRLHTGKTLPGAFYPLLISVRRADDMDIPVSTEVVSDDAALLQLLQKRYPMLKTIGVVIGESAASDPSFNQQMALTPILTMTRRIEGAQVLVFHEKDGEIISMETVKE